MDKNEIAIDCFEVFGIIAGALVGFTAVFVWRSYNESVINVRKEASNLFSLERVSIGINDPTLRDLIVDAVVKYRKSIICDEFPWMADGRSRIVQTRPNCCCTTTDSNNDLTDRSYSHPKTLELYEKLWKSVYEANPASEMDKLSISIAMGIMTKIEVERRRRILESATPALPVIFWAVLIIAIVGIIVYPFFIIRGPPFFSKSKIVCSLTIAILSASVLFLVYQMNRPFRGILRIKDNEFVN